MADYCIPEYSAAVDANGDEIPTQGYITPMVGEWDSITYDIIESTNSDPRLFSVGANNRILTKDGINGPLTDARIPQYIGATKLPQGCKHFAHKNAILTNRKAYGTVPTNQFLVVDSVTGEIYTGLCHGTSGVVQVKVLPTIEPMQNALPQPQNIFFNTDILIITNKSGFISLVYQDTKPSGGQAVYKNGSEFYELTIGITNGNVAASFADVSIDTEYSGTLTETASGGLTGSETRVLGLDGVWGVATGSFSWVDTNAFAPVTTTSHSEEITIRSFYYDFDTEDLYPLKIKYIVDVVAHWGVAFGGAFRSGFSYQRKEALEIIDTADSVYHTETNQNLGDQSSTNVSRTTTLDSNGDVITHTGPPLSNNATHQVPINREPSAKLPLTPIGGKNVGDDRYSDAYQVALFNSKTISLTTKKGSNEFYDIPVNFQGNNIGVVIDSPSVTIDAALNPVTGQGIVGLPGTIKKLYI